MKSFLKSLCVFAGIPLMALISFAGDSNELREPPVFNSSRGVLEVLITAKVKPLALDSYNTTSWVYEVCYRRAAKNNVCPSDSRTASPYGGMRLQLNPGDHLKIRFINQLPVAPPDAEHAQDMPEMLGANPTNLHTHGLIVEPRQATKSNRTYGDYVFVLSYPKGKLPAMQHPGFDYTDQPLDYDIYIPPNHPSGLFWLHPHVHGLALNQITYGLAGIITIGSVSDILGQANSVPPVTPAVRHLTLKDIQLKQDNSVLSQEFPVFCDADPTLLEPPRNGFCPGIDSTGQDGGGYFIGGKWVHTINGQEYPTITMASTGEIWRITQASGNRSYQLSIDDDASGKSLPFQVLAIDGIAIDADANLNSVAASVAGKFTPIACSNGASTGSVSGVCATSIRMMPSSRVELYVPAAGNSASATLLTRSYVTGGPLEGDNWPSIRLAHVVFPQVSGQAWYPLDVKGAAQTLTSTGILSGPVKIDDGATGAGVALQSATQRAAHLAPEAAEVLNEHLAALSAPSAVPSQPCVALPHGHYRRIFFGHDVNKAQTFGMGYEEVDESGKPVPGTFRDIMEFDHSVIDVCLPLGNGNETVDELWELVNVAGEDHNFHIHQTKFKVFSEPQWPTVALVDNIPVPHGTVACDGSVATWRSGACKVQPVHALIPFSEVGDFVYHCHILEHEDGGMMAHIRVVPNP